ncbi:response regulator transcription factor [Serratia fonticola]|uniref:response regulator transcription factor n=1 Tax=Serratia fonticola TaxID=47917 RepID=UPI000E0FC396|nr:LuxR C-terminal-related transcriptional regulator [Serratia fonticola]RDL15171.1 regulatory LuxR family protein [Serratia fonticola]
MNTDTLYFEEAQRMKMKMRPMLKKTSTQPRLTICIHLRDNYFSQGLQSIIRAYFDNLGTLATFIIGEGQRVCADILFCDASPYHPQLACAKTSTYRRIFIIEHIPKTPIKTPCSCGCEDALFSYNTRPEEIIRKLGDVLIAPPSEEKKPCLASTLSNREKQILNYIVQGMSQKRISDVLLISPKTLSTHKMNTMKKLGINTSTGLLYWLRENATHLLPIS